MDRVDDDMTWVRCRLVSDLANSKGEVFGEREHHTALVRLVKKHEDLRPFLQREVDALPSIGTPPQGELLHPASFIYDRYFHGPRFQSHGGVLRGVGEGDRQGIDGRALMRHQLPATTSSRWSPKASRCSSKPFRCSLKRASKTPVWLRWNCWATAVCRSVSTGRPCSVFPMLTKPCGCAAFKRCPRRRCDGSRCVGRRRG